MAGEGVWPGMWEGKVGGRQRELIEEEKLIQLDRILQCHSSIYVFVHAGLPVPIVTISAAVLEVQGSAYTAGT